MADRLEPPGGDGTGATSPGLVSDLLSQFVGATGADPGLAQDLLSAVNNDIEAAVKMYNDMMAPPPPQYEDFGSFAEVPLKEEPEQSNPQRRKKRRKKGIINVSSDVIDKFHEESQFKCTSVSVGEELVPTIDDKFFHHTFVFPDVSFDERDYAEYLMNDLLEISHKTVLEKSGKLNWWSATGQCPPLEPLATSGDGNCLLHAASLGMWGIPDTDLILRSAVHKFLTSACEREGIKRRWRYQMEKRFVESGGFTLSDNEWEKEWTEILRIAKSEARFQKSYGKEKGDASDSSSLLSRTSTLRASYESLEEVHVLVLAHVLKRPIVVLANTVLLDIHGQDLAPIYFSGIYLPFEYNPKNCFKSPIVLAYDSSHFSPLLAKDASAGSKQSKVLKVNLRSSAVIPLVSPEGQILPIQFLFDPDKDSKEEIARIDKQLSDGEFPPHYITSLESYMDIRWIKLGKGGSTQPKETDTSQQQWRVPSVRFPAAQISYLSRPPYQEFLLQSYLSKSKERFEEFKKECREMEEERQKRLAEPDSTVGGWQQLPCLTEGCFMFGTFETGSLCSKCYKEHHSSMTQDRGEIREDPCGSEEKSSDVTFQDEQEDPEASRSRDAPKSSSLTSVESQTTQSLPATASVTSTGVQSATKLSDTTKVTDLQKEIPSSSQPSKQPTSKNQSPNVNPKAAAIADKIASQVRRSPPMLRKKAVKEGRYSRDHIKPLGHGQVEDLETLKAEDQATPIFQKCKNTGCNFFGSKDRNGLCSQCFQETEEQ